MLELETHIQIAPPWAGLNYINENQIKKVLDKTVKIGRMLNGVRKSIEKKILTPYS